MKGKMTGAVGLAGAFVAGVVLATALVGGMAAARAKTLEAAVQAASYPEEGLQPDGDGRGHRFASARYASKENASDWAEHVTVGYGGAEVLAHLQALRERLA